MARTHKQNAFAKMNVRADFEKKHCTDEIRGYINRYRELKLLINEEKWFTKQYTKLWQEISGLRTCIHKCWKKEYLRKNPNKTINDFIDLQNSWLLSWQETKAINTPNGAFVQC